MKKAIVIFFATVFSACSVKLLVPSQTDVDRVSRKYSGYSLTELNEGKTLYQQQCGNCHGLKKPSSRTEAQWNEIVPKMTKKANKNAEVISAKTQELILKYLITMSTAPKTK